MGAGSIAAPRAEWQGKIAAGTSGSAEASAAGAAAASQPRDGWAPSAYLEIRRYSRRRPFSTASNAPTQTDGSPSVWVGALGRHFHGRLRDGRAASRDRPRDPHEGTLDEQVDEGSRAGQGDRDRRQGEQDGVGAGLADPAAPFDEEQAQGDAVQEVDGVGTFPQRQCAARAQAAEQVVPAGDRVEEEADERELREAEIEGSFIAQRPEHVGVDAAAVRFAEQGRLAPAGDPRRGRPQVSPSARDAPVLDQRIRPAIASRRPRAGRCGRPSS